MVFADCLPGQCQMFIDVLYQFILKGNFLHRRRLFSFLTHEFDLHAPLCRTLVLNICFSSENKSADHRITQQISVALEVHRSAFNPFGCLRVLKALWLFSYS